MGTFAGLQQLADLVKKATPTPSTAGPPVERVANQPRPNPPPQPHLIPCDDEHQQRQRVSNSDDTAPQRVPAGQSPQRVPHDVPPQRVHPVDATNEPRPIRDPVFGKPIRPTTHRYPTRAKALNLLLSQGIPAHFNQHSPTANASTGNLPPYLINAIIDDIAGQVDLEALLHGTPQLNTLETNAVIDPVIGMKRDYRHLITDERTKVIWDHAMGTEVERLLETKTIKFVKRKDIPPKRKVAYIRIVVDIRQAKAVQERVRLTVGGDQVDYPCKVTTRTAELQTCKIHLNGVISTEGARFMCADIKNFYLGTPLDREEYARITASSPLFCIIIIQFLDD